MSQVRPGVERPRRGRGIGRFLNRYDQVVKGLLGTVTVLETLVTAVISAANFDILTTAGMAAISLISGGGGAFYQYSRTKPWTGPVRARLAMQWIPRLVLQYGVLAIVGILAFVGLALARTPLVVFAVVVYPFYLTSAVALIAEYERASAEPRLPRGVPIATPGDKVVVERMIEAMVRNSKAGGPEAVLGPCLEPRERQQERLRSFLPLHPGLSRLRLASIGELWVLEDEAIVAVPIPPGLSYDAAVALHGLVILPTLPEIPQIVAILPADLSLEVQRFLRHACWWCDEGGEDITPPRNLARLTSTDNASTDDQAGTSEVSNSP
jgi:hypothetical protein